MRTDSASYKKPMSDSLARWNLLHGVTLGVVAISCIGHPLDACGASDKRPNIVFLMTDDQCTYSLGCYGTPNVLTPRIDQLAREGVAFDNFYVSTAICMASRATFMTGLYEYRTGCNFDRGPLMRSFWSNSYPVVLKKAGYAIAFAGKFGFEVADAPDEPGVLPADEFDSWGGGPGQTFYETEKNPSMAHYADEFPHSTLAYGAFGRDFIRNAAQQDRPFCLSISFKAPHLPVTPDPRFDEVYAGMIFTKPRNFGREFGKHFAPQSRQGRQYERFVTWHYNDDYDHVMAKYYQQIYGVDVAVGMICDALEECGVADNTVVIFTSDNGFMCGSHGYGSKVLPYEESSRVPLIVMDPREPANERGVRCNALCCSADIAPTILALSHTAAPVDVDGKSMLPLLDDNTAMIHDAAPLINVWGPAATHSLAVVTKNWKYIYWPYSQDGFTPREELYHTGVDPLELRDLSAEPQSKTALHRMQAVYDRQVETWKRLAVDYHGYQQFGKIFARRSASDAQPRLVGKRVNQTNTDEVK